MTSSKDKFKWGWGDFRLHGMKRGGVILGFDGRGWGDFS